MTAWTGVQSRSRTVKIFAAVAGQQVGAAHSGLPGGGGFFEKPVSALVAVLVVELFEVIKIEEGDIQPAAGERRTRAISRAVSSHARRLGIPVSPSLWARAASWVAWSWTLPISPPMRSTTSRNSTTELSAMAATSIGWWRSPCWASTAGAIREVVASRARRQWENRVAWAG